METQEEYASLKKVGKQHNTLPIYGNENTMNLNPLILTNIQGSSYFKVTLFKLKTYHEVVDEIYYQVKHLEPWERGSRKTSGQTGMCGGVRGVGAGGIVSTAFCLLYKLYTLRLTRKQVNGLLNHTDSPYIRALGFMYIRFTQPPGDLYDWYEDYFLDEEEIDVKAGSGQVMNIGQMVYQFLTKLDWFSTLFPRIPVPIQKQIEKKVELYCRSNNVSLHQLSANSLDAVRRNNYPAAGSSSSSSTTRNPGEYDRREPTSSTNYGSGNYGREREYDSYRDEYKRSRSRERNRDDQSGSRERKHKKKHKHRSRSREDRKEREYSNRDRNRDREYERKH